MHSPSSLRRTSPSHPPRSTYAAFALVLAAVLALSACGIQRSHEVTSSTAVTTPTEPRRTVAAPPSTAPCDEQTVVDQIPPGVTVPEPPVIGGEMFVLSHTCEVGISTWLGPLDATGRAGFAPIHPLTGDRDRIIGYWVGGSGWLTPEQAAEANWGPAEAQRLFPDPRLEIGPATDDPFRGGKPAP